MQIALNRRLALMASQRDSRPIRAHSRWRCHNLIRPPFQGEFRLLPDPGLKPWANSNRCAVKSDSL